MIFRACLVEVKILIVETRILQMENPGDVKEFFYSRQDELDDLIGKHNQRKQYLEQHMNEKVNYLELIVHTSYSCLSLLSRFMMSKDISFI